MTDDTSSSRYRHLVVLAGVLLALAVWVVLPGTTLAHAKYLRSTPESGAMVSNPPTRIDVWFTETVASGVSSIQIYDADHRRIETTTSTVDPNDAHHLSVELPSLDPGVYTVVWANVSSDDGHPAKGGFAFTLLTPAGSSVPSAAPSEVTTTTTDLISGSSDSVAQTVNLVAGWLVMLAFVLAGGGALFLLLCLAPALRQPGTGGNVLWMQLNRRFALIAIAAAVIGAFAALATLFAKANIATGKTVVQILSSGVLGHMLAPWSGRIWIAREVAFVAIFVMAIAWLLSTRRGGALSRQRGSLALSVIAFLGLSGLALQALDSHLAAGHVARDGPLGIVALALHLVAVGAWIGGLGIGALLLVPVWRGLDGELRKAITSKGIARFSMLGLASVALIGLSGIYVTVLMIPSAGDLLSSTYGLALDLKVILFFALIIIGALNRTTLASLAAAAPSALEDAVHRAGERLLKAMRREFVIAGVILLAAAIMLSVGPPSVALRFGTTNLMTTVDLQPASSSAGSPMTEAGPDSTTYASQAKAGDLSVTIKVDPAVAGASNTFSLSVRDADGAPVSGAEVKLWLTAKAFDMGTQMLKAEPTSPGSYQVESPALAAPGEWDTQVVIRRDNMPEAETAFTVPAAEPSLANAATATGSTVTSLRAELSLSPASPSVGRFNWVKLHVTDQSGKPVDGAQVLAVWDMPQMGHELHTDLLPVAGELGTYETHVNFIMQGGWNGNVELTLPDGRKVRPTFSLNVEPRVGSASGTSLVPAVFNGNTLIALVAIAGAVGALVVSRGSKGRGLERVLGIAIAMVLLAVGLGTGWVSVNDAYRQQVANPVPATAESIARGSSLYQANCSVCHGADARGRGPMAQTLNPPPSDLTIHIPQHPDVDLFDFVSNGIPGTAMPAFKDRLSEEERWDVLNYLKSAAAET